MEPPHPAPDGSSPGPALDVDVLIVGAGVTGIYQLYRAREAGFSVEAVEAGGGVGGTWYWNRYPGARFDSESYTYAYLFSKELFDDWTWEEHFAEQPETERYLNHVVDRFDLLRHIRFDVEVTSASYDEPSRRWIVALSDGTERRARFLVAATGVVSVPHTRGFDTIEVDPAAEERWTDMVDRGAAAAPFGERSYFFGSNIPGKPRKYLLNSGGRPKLFKEIARVVETDYKAFLVSRPSTGCGHG